MWGLTGLSLLPCISFSLLYSSITLSRPGENSALLPSFSHSSLFGTSTHHSLYSVHLPWHFMTPLSTGSTKLQISDEVGFQEMFRACLLWVVDLFGGGGIYLHMLDFIISIFFPTKNCNKKTKTVSAWILSGQKRPLLHALFVVRLLITWVTASGANAANIVWGSYTKPLKKVKNCGMITKDLKADLFFHLSCHPLE